MKRSYFRKITSFILILSIILPLIIGFTHVLDDHEHDICKAKTETHIHSKKSNCSSLHYFTHFQYKSGLNYLEIHGAEYFQGPSIQLNFLFYFTYISSNFERGPPSFNVL